MRFIGFLIVIVLAASGEIAAQAKAGPQRKGVKAPARRSAKTPPKADAGTDSGVVAGRTYTNKPLGFDVTFPDSWLIPGNDFDDYMKKQGFDLSLKAPDSLPAVSKITVDKAISRVNILLTAYRSMPGSADNAIVRISTEDLSLNPQIHDAVDYFDAIRSMYSRMKLPADFKYSETQAETLGRKQFGYLDTSSESGKKRMYATVKDGVAIMFTISYKSDEDLQTLRHVLEEGKFN